MKLRDLFNELSEIMAIASNREHDWSKRDEFWEFAGEWLEAHGFRYLDSGCFSRAYMSTVHGGIVVKISRSGVNAPDLEECPWLRAVWLRPLFKSQCVMVQPLAECHLTWKAQATVRETIQADPRNLTPWRAYDMHEGNVGWFRGRAVSFDIMANSSSTWDDYGSPHYSSSSRSED